VVTSNKQIEAKLICLHAYILIYLYPVNPVKKPNEANSELTCLCNLRNPWFLFLQNKAISTFLYTCIHVSLYSCLLPNKPNFSVFGLKMRVVPKNKPNLQSSIVNQEFRNEPNFKVAQASVLESKSVSAPADSLNFDFCTLPFDMILPNEPKTSFFN